MFDTTRRGLLKAAAALPLAMQLRIAAAQPAAAKASTVKASLAAKPGAPSRPIGEALTGFSYETLQLADASYFSPDNHALVALFRQLSPQGVLRIGGNTSDFTTWTGFHGPLAAQKPSKKTGPQQPFLLKPEALRLLAGFLKATGWKLVFGVNLKVGSPGMALALAQAVRDAVGEQLLAIQIGNESNNYETDYAAFDTAWTPYAKAISRAGLPIAGPDTGANTDWVLDFASRHGSESSFLSRHYYRDEAPRGSIQDLLGNDPGFYEQIDMIVASADRLRRPFFITEANSYYFGGRDGVSNTFASTLWGADFLLAAAARGVAGVQFHGGTLVAVESSLGRDAAIGHAGDAEARRDAITSRYGPIAGDAALGFRPRPLYHGMALAQRFAGATMLTTTLDTGGANLTAYAAQQDQNLLIALINKDSDRDVVVELAFPGYAPAKLERLQAASLDSRSVTGLAEAALPAITSASQQVPALNVPRGSAALLEMRKTGTAAT